MKRGLSEKYSTHTIVVTHLERESRGRKDDLTDAFSRAEELRVGAVKPVFKDGGRMGELRAHVDVQAQVTADVVRVQNRLKALYRSRGVSSGRRCAVHAIAAQRVPEQVAQALPVVGAAALCPVRCAAFHRRSHKRSPAG
jgi:hypothetical protein